MRVSAMPARAELARRNQTTTPRLQTHYLHADNGVRGLEERSESRSAEQKRMSAKG